MPTTAEELRYRVSVEDDELATVVTQPTGRAGRCMVLMLHGGPGGEKDGPEQLYANLARQLAELGIASVRFDFRGCGESTGRYRDMTIRRQVREMRAVREFVDERFRPGAWVLIGESFGATIGLSDLHPAYKAIVMLWPAIWLLDGTFESYLHPAHLEAAEHEGFSEIDGEQIGLDFLHELQQVVDVSAPLVGLATPVLFIHGTADREVPFQQSVRAAELVGGARKVVVIDDGDHCLERPHEREIVHRETVTWIAAHL
ncbi:alpha/beta hydrolase family protein [Micromonospora sp. LOL_021]|uniref:alpha/beta hydrolase family protein n=1 Tax=Micromonospora sp. LOL_021 TaxID=3345417 RepID=UPI003A884E77